MPKCKTCATTLTCPGCIGRKGKGVKKGGIWANMDAETRSERMRKVSLGKKL